MFSLTRSIFLEEDRNRWEGKKKGKKKKGEEKEGRKEEKESKNFPLLSPFPKGSIYLVYHFSKSICRSRGLIKPIVFGFPFTNENFIGRCYWLRIWYIAASQEGRLFFFVERGKKKKEKKETFQWLITIDEVVSSFRRLEESVIIWNPLMDVLLDSFVSTVSGCSIKNSDIHWPNELLCHRRGQHHEALSNSKLHFTPACRTTAPPGSLRVLRVLRINHRVISYASNVTSTPMCSKVCSSSIRMDGRHVDCFQNYFFRQMFGY